MILVLVAVHLFAIFTTEFISADLEKLHVIKQASCFPQYMSHTCGTSCVCVCERERERAILLVSITKSDGPNVVSESALKQLTMNKLQEEYGCMQRKVRLAPDLTKMMQWNTRGV